MPVYQVLQGYNYDLGERVKCCLPCCSALYCVHVHEQDSDGTYGVILRIVKAGCHLVAIAQVVELKSEAPGSILGGCRFTVL